MPQIAALFNGVSLIGVLDELADYFQAGDPKYDPVENTHDIYLSFDGLVSNNLSLIEKFRSTGYTYQVNQDRGMIGVTTDDGIDPYYSYGFVTQKDRETGKTLYILRTYDTKRYGGYMGGPSDGVTTTGARQKKLWGFGEKGEIPFDILVNLSVNYPEFDALVRKKIIEFDNPPNLKHFKRQLYSVVSLDSLPEIGYSIAFPCTVYMLNKSASPGDSYYKGSVYMQAQYVNPTLIKEGVTIDATGLDGISSYNPFLDHGDISTPAIPFLAQPLEPVSEALPAAVQKIRDEEYNDGFISHDGHLSFGGDSVG